MSNVMITSYKESSTKEKLNKKTYKSYELEKRQPEEQKEEIDFKVKRCHLNIVTYL